MKIRKRLILIDSAINCFLGIVLLAYSEPVITFFGLPETESGFYPNILGAVLLGIGIALLIELYSKADFSGLGLAGAICINMIGGIVLFLWLLFGDLPVPLRGKIILWSLVVILVVISFIELIVYLRKIPPE